MIVYRELSSLARDLGVDARLLYAVSNSLDRHYRQVCLPKKDGGVRVMQNLIRRQQVSDVFDGLEKAGQLALSPEAAVTQSAYGALFTDDEVNWCFQQLCDAGYFG